MFERLKSYMYGEFSEDYWSDEGIGIAVKFMKDFSPSDWDALKLHVETERDEPWLIRCENILGDIPNQISLEILTALIVEQSDEVTVAALDSINSLASLGVELSFVHAVVLKAIERLDRRTTSGIEKIGLERLAAHLK